MRRLLFILLASLPCVISAQAVRPPVPYGIEADVFFWLLDDAGSLLESLEDSGDDVTVDPGCDGDEAASENEFEEVESTPGLYKVRLTAAELSAAVVCVTVDVSGAERESFMIDTYGHPASRHPRLGR